MCMNCEPNKEEVLSVIRNINGQYEKVIFETFYHICKVYNTDRDDRLYVFISNYLNSLDPEIKNDYLNRVNELIN